MKRLTTLTTVVLLCLGSNALAQQKQQISFKIPAENNKFTQQQNIDVGDTPNHIVRIVEVRRTFLANPPIINGLKLVEEWDRGTADIAEGNGTASIYNVFMMENGDKFFARSAAVIQTSSGKLSATAVGHITGGTGKVVAIQGTFRSVTNFDPKSGFNETAGEIEYSIGK